MCREVCREVAPPKTRALGKERSPKLGASPGFLQSHWVWFPAVRLSLPHPSLEAQRGEGPGLKAVPAPKGALGAFGGGRRPVSVCGELGGLGRKANPLEVCSGKL